MLQLRPTFSESWYRVKDLKPKLRATAQISRQHYRGERWYVVRDPSGNQFHRLSDAAYKFIGLLDGRRSVDDAWNLVGGTLEDDAPTQPEVIQILSQLYAANLVETDIPPDATVLLRRHKKQMQRKMQMRLMNLLFPRIPIWDCDKFLVRWMPVVRLLLSKVGMVFWLLVVGTAIAMITPEWPALKEAAKNSIAPSNWMWLWAVFVLTKFIHELGHAFSCRRFGGEVHEMGIMFLVFIPTPYVDASTAWGFSNKWQRMFVGMAGMWIELLVAAFCAIAWVLVGDHTSLVSQLLYNAMLIASVSTVVFNANPLLRYDGYYILSDWLEIPNLQRRSSEYALGIVKRNVFNVKSNQPLPPIGQRMWLFNYAWASTAYRVMVGMVIMLMVFYQLPDEVKVIGVIMGLGAVVTWFVMPIGKLIKYLSLDPELHRKRGRAIAFCSVLGILGVGFVAAVPMPMRIRAVGIVEAAERENVHATIGGFIDSVAMAADNSRFLRDGDAVTKGQPILLCHDDNINAEIAKLKHKIFEYEARVRASGVVSAADRRGDLEGLNYLRQQAIEFNKRQDELTLRAPIDGYLVAPELSQMPGQYVGAGMEVFTVQTRGDAIIRANVDQRDAELVRSAKLKDPNVTTEIRPAGRIGMNLETKNFELLESAQPQMVDSSLTHMGGGDQQNDPSDPSGKTPLVKQFEIRIPVSSEMLAMASAADDTPLVPGQRANVRISLDKRPLGVQWYRAILQLIQANSENKMGGEENARSSLRASQQQQR